MQHEYDGLADSYRRNKQSPFRTYLEAPLFRAMVGSCRDHGALDLACGEGYFSRMLAEMGASPVVGIDLSADMIELARRQEQKRPLGIEYLVGDAAVCSQVGPFPLVTAGYLFNCAVDRTMLANMFANIVDYLSPGGRLVSIYGMTHRAVGLDMSRYGVRTVEDHPPAEGEEYRLEMWDGTSWFQVRNHAWEPDTLARCAEEAGLREVEWHSAELNQEGRDLAPELLELPAPIFVGMTARRPA